MNLRSNPEKFQKHFLLTLKDAIEYTQEVLYYFPEGSKLKGEEIGDGNINYIYRIWETSSKKSLIIKQGDKLLRSSQRPLSLKRTEVEAKALMGYAERSPGLAPKIIHFDPAMSIIAMEDLKEFENLREALMKGEVFPTLIDDITTFIAENALGTSVLVMAPKIKTQMEKQFFNDEMEEITETLVFTEPYNDYRGRNNYTEGNKEFIKKELYQDKELHGQVGLLKETFMNRREALIHGDLHTGSVFVTEHQTKILDGEFASYGPISFDIGTFLGNLFFPMAYHRVGKSVDDQDTIQFLMWLEKSVKSLLKTFSLHWCRRFNEEVKDPIFKTPGFQEAYFNRILRESIAMAGLEMIRRAIGDARVPEVESIEDLNRRKKVERVLVLTGKAFIKNHLNLRRGEEIIEEFEKAMFDVEKMEEEQNGRDGKNGKN